MLTTQEIRCIRRSGEICLEDLFYGRLRLEEMGSYFRREKKENLLEQGWPVEIDPDDECIAVPDCLREKQDPDTRSRYSGDYDGGEVEEVPHYGSRLFWQWKAIKEGRFNYLRVYGFDGNEINVSERTQRKLLYLARSFLTENASSSISNEEKGYKLWQVKREELGIQGMNDLAFVTMYLFPRN